MSHSVKGWTARMIAGARRSHHVHWPTATRAATVTASTATITRGDDHPTKTRAAPASDNDPAGSSPPTTGPLCPTPGAARLRNLWWARPRRRTTGIRSADPGEAEGRQTWHGRRTIW